MIGCAYYSEVEVDELGGRTALALLNENDGTSRMRERAIRHRAIDAVVDAAVRARARLLEREVA